MLSKNLQVVSVDCIGLDESPGVKVHKVKYVIDTLCKETAFEFTI